MSDRTLRIIMNGVTGRMGHRQHLVRSVLAIRDEGGIERSDGSRLQVEPILVGRNRDKLAELADPQLAELYLGGRPATATATPTNAATHEEKAL